MRKYLAVLLLFSFVFALVLNTNTTTQAQAAWAPNTAYAIGNLVTYNGIVYKCIQAHTSQVGWEPPNVPALWTPQSGTAAPTNTTAPTTAPTKTNTPAAATNTPVGPTATKTNTPVGPTATKTNTAVPPTATTVAATATTGSGGNCSPAYVPGNIYTANMIVSYQGHNWLAKWWTQNEAPSTGGSGVWQDNGACSTGPTNTPTFVPPTATMTKTNTPGGPTATTSSGGSLKMLGYYADWDVYARGYFPKGMVTSGMAAKMDYLIFAFGNVSSTGCTMGNSYADSQENYTAANSVSGVADSTSGTTTTGLIHQFQEMKALYPNLKIIWSFGGWTWSGNFGAAAANAAAFASNCYALVHNAAWNGTFSGIDIDWEYPNACGLSCDTSGFSSYPTLMSALRSQFGSDLVTAAITADGTSGGHMDAADYGGAAQYVNWYNLMTYDYFGAWAATGPTAPQAPLTSYTGIPTAGFYADAAVQKLKSKGVAGSKINLGIGFYGRGWTGVTQAAPGGSASAAATGTYEAGIEDYRVLVNTCPSNGTIAGTAYAFCAPNWWSYDTPSTVASKESYAKSQGLGGAFFWEAFGDTTSGSLTSAMYSNR